MRPRREAAHSPLSIAEAKNAWNYTSTPQYVFMARCSVKKITATPRPLEISGFTSTSNGASWEAQLHCEHYRALRHLNMGCFGFESQTGYPVLSFWSLPLLEGIRLTLKGHSSAEILKCYKATSRPLGLIFWHFSASKKKIKSSPCIMTPCCDVLLYRRFGEPCCIHLQSEK
jgi:hypothetical protein